MRNQGNQKSLTQILQKNQNIQEFYDPLTPTQLVKKKNIPIKSSACFKSLFNDNDDQQNNSNLPSINSQQFINQNDKENQQVSQNLFLKKIFANAKNPKKIQTLIKKQKTQFQPFQFNKKIQIKYPQTPHFKNQLLSPFWKFNKDNKYNLDTLQKNITKGNKIQYPSIPLDDDPLLYVSEPAKFFIGIAMKMKQKNHFNQCMMALKLSCYVQPYNQKTWKKYIQYVQNRGQIRKCFNLSKTAFLFCPNEDFAKMYLSFGQKINAPLQQLKGIITNVSNPDLFQKIILAQIGKICLKNRQVNKGLKIIFQICIWNELKLQVCSLIYFLVKTLQNIGFRDKAISILKKSFGKNMSKLEIYILYLQIKNRQTQGNISQGIIKQILDYSQNISGQNKYKLYLQIAQILFKQNNENYKKLLQQSYFAARNYCAPGTGCNKALRHIFFCILRWKKVIYPFNPVNDLSAFQLNRQRYIIGQNLIKYDFVQWKFYLIYGLQKNDQLLYQASKKFPCTGRLIAQWIHCLRLKKPILQMLRIWRQKIKQVPKSGQLWCEGGRIYSQLKDYQNASKCYRFAINFTPQYGDSFFEQLKILLIKGKFHEINKLKNTMFVSQPFYGHVWSYLKGKKLNYKPSLIDLWNEGLQQIKENIYKQNIQIFKNTKRSQSFQLTALSSYNQAYKNPNSQQIRIRLFNSYQQLESRN